MPPLIALVTIRKSADGVRTRSPIRERHASPVSFALGTHPLRNSASMLTSGFRMIEAALYPECDTPKLGIRRSTSSQLHYGRRRRKPPATQEKDVPPRPNNFFKPLIVAELVSQTLWRLRVLVVQSLGGNAIRQNSGEGFANSIPTSCFSDCRGPR